MLWIFVFLLLNKVQQIFTDITIESRTCGTQYDADYYKSVSVEHDGSSLLHHNPCYIEFTKSSSDQILCVSGERIMLDCGTSLEYHEGFVKNYISPERKFSCSDISRDEWCPSQYQDNIFIVIRKSAEITSDRIRLRVYLKDVPDEDSSVVLYAVLPIVIIVIVACVVVIACQKASKAMRRPPQAAYQTASGTVNMQAGQCYPSQYPTTAGFQPSPNVNHPVQHGDQQHSTGPQANYNVYPMQTAYAVNPDSTPVYRPLLPQERTADESSAYAQPYPSAPPLNTDAPPPSYESVVGMKH